MRDTRGSTVDAVAAAQLVRYGLVGIATNLAGYLAFVWVVAAGAEPKVAMTVLYTVGVGIGYLGHRHWAFAHRGSWSRAGVRYGIAYAAGYLLNPLILFCFVDLLGQPAEWVQAGAIVVVAGFLFLTLRHYAFPAITGGGRA